MKKSTWMSVVTILVLIGLEVGAFTLAALQYRERTRVFLVAVILCVVAIAAGSIVTRAKKLVTSYWMIGVGIVILAIGLFALKILIYHERAAVPLGTGIICIVAGCAGLTLRRSVTAALAGLALLGFVGFGLGLFTLNILDYENRAYMILATSALCALIGLVGILIVQYRRTSTTQHLQS